MPVLEAAQGLELPAIRTRVITTWAMNFSAGAAGSPCMAFLDTRDGRKPQVHPMFLAGCVEVVGAFGSIYEAGLTKEEIVTNTFLHHFCDVQIERPLRAEDEIETRVKLARVKQKPKGVYTGTSFEHLDSSGEVVAKGYFGGVIENLKGADREPATVPEYVPVPVKPGPDVKLDESMDLVIHANAAHVWDACIRNPRVPKAPSSDINVHTNLGLARKAGLRDRTHNGLALLSNVVSSVMEARFADQPERIARVCCSFSAPLFLAQDDVCVTVHLSSAEASPDTIFFEVCLAQDPSTKVLKNGAILLRPAAPAKL